METFFILIFFLSFFTQIAGIFLLWLPRDKMIKQRLCMHLHWLRIHWTNWSSWHHLASQSVPTCAEQIMWVNGLVWNTLGCRICVTIPLYILCMLQDLFNEKLIEREYNKILFLSFWVLKYYLVLIKVLKYPSTRYLNFSDHSHDSYKSVEKIKSKLWGVGFIIDEWAHTL